MHTSFVHRLAPLALATLGFSAPLASAQAAVILGNMPQTNDSSNNIFPNSNFGKFFKFSLPVGDDYELDDIIVRLSGYESFDSVDAGIYFDNGSSNPGTLLMSLTAPTGQGGGTFDYTLTPGAAFTFSNDTAYWFALGPATGGFTWRVSSPGVAYSGVASLTDNRSTSNNGASYINSTTLNTFQINGTAVSAVPEPAGYALMLVGLAALGAAARRRKA